MTDASPSSRVQRSVKPPKTPYKPNKQAQGFSERNVSATPRPTAYERQIERRKNNPEVLQEFNDERRKKRNSYDRLDPCRQKPDSKKAGKIRAAGTGSSKPEFYKWC